jgi:hypothetical protein
MVLYICFKSMDYVLSFNILIIFIIRALIYQNFKIMIIQLNYYHSVCFNHFKFLFRLLMFNHALYEMKEYFNKRYFFIILFFFEILFLIFI